MLFTKRWRPLPVMNFSKQTTSNRMIEEDITMMLNGIDFETYFKHFPDE